jgi:PAS domain S-box-containing protein
MFRDSAGVSRVKPSSGVGLRRSRHRERQQARHRADAVAILESLDPAVLGQDLDGVVGTWSSGAERLYGYSALEMIGHELATVVPLARRSWEVDVLRVSVLAGLCDSYETVRLCKDGSEVAVVVQSSRSGMRRARS